MIRLPLISGPDGDSNGQATIASKDTDDSKGQATIASKDIYEYGMKTQEGKPSSSSSDETTYESVITFPSYYEIKEKSESAVRIVRTFYTKKINASLEWLSTNHKTPMSSTPYIQPLLDNLKKYRDEHFVDPYSSFLSALYDALVSDDSWMKLKREDFAELIKIIIPLSNRRQLGYDTIDKAINELEKLGLDSTPF